MIARLSLLCGVSMTFALSGCAIMPSQREAALREQGVTNPWAVDTTKNYRGEGLITALDGLHPLGSEFCMATRHVVPIAPRPLSLEKKSHVRTVRAIAWAPCNAARSSQFRDVYGDYSEADILAALTAVELFGRSGARALTGIRVEEPRLHDDEIAAFVKPEKFHGIYTGSSDTSEDGYHGSMEIEFNADPEGWTIDPASFSVVVEDGKVTAIVTSRLYSTVEY